MVHALQRAGQSLRPGGALVSIQPHWTRRPLIAVAAPRRIPVVSLINPAFERYLSAAQSALRRVVHDDQFTFIGEADHRYRVHLASLSELRAYIDLLTPRPRFPAGGRQRLHEIWSSRLPSARIEVTESMVIAALRVRSRPSRREL